MFVWSLIRDERGWGQTPDRETLLRSKGSFDKGSKVENVFVDPSSGMRGVGVKNLIETLLSSEGSIDKGSKIENVSFL